MSEPVYCARCNVRIYGQTFICCEQLLHGQCFTRHRKESHVGQADALRGMLLANDAGRPTVEGVA